ncbi:hypothetical protein [Enterococcus sp. DIV0756]|uniref:hypothetical protein n=1 Tax=Enterococcus sp. DIV0756 TaxID=2774636 RepID=UPI003F216B5A
MTRAGIETLFDRITYINTAIEKSKDKDIFILIEHSFYMPYITLLYNTDFNILSSKLETILKERSSKYRDVKDFETLSNNSGELIAYRGYWTGEDNEDPNYYFYEGGIIKASEYRD